MRGNPRRFALALVISLGAHGALAEDGVSDKVVLFGQVAALQGPARDLGLGMRDGILAAFAEVNRSGGIAGRSLQLKSLDDGYEPEKTVATTKQIIQDDKVFALLGAVGTPTSKAGQPPLAELLVQLVRRGE